MIGDRPANATGSDSAGAGVGLGAGAGLGTGAAGASGETGATSPAEMIIFMACSTVSLEFMTRESSMMRTNPVMGFGEVGRKTVVTGLPMSWSWYWPVTKATRRDPGDG